MTVLVILLVPNPEESHSISVNRGEQCGLTAFCILMENMDNRMKTYRTHTHTIKKRNNQTLLINVFYSYYVTFCNYLNSCSYLLPSSGKTWEFKITSIYINQQTIVN